MRREPANLQTGYRHHSLAALVRLIVSDSDTGALEEFHQQRSVFDHFERTGLRLGEYLQLLRRHVPEKQSGLADEAYTLTLEKFLHFPDASSQVDCRKYFSAALTSLEEHRWRGELEADKRLARILQQMLAKHFGYSLSEAARSQSGFGRYNWNTPQGTLVVMMPRSLSGAQRREWLENHITPEMLSGSDAGRVIQSRVREHFSEVMLDSTVSPQVADDRVRMPWDSMDSLNVNELAERVADEKVDTLSEQRRPIQELGAEGLRSLILNIFSAVAEDEASDAEIARTYGLSTATFSRFAGRKWSRIPDLWKNTAQLVAHNPQYKEALGL